MIYRVIAVRDRAADCYGAPQFVASLGAAIRGFSDEVNRVAEGNAFNAHPEDFDLYELGSFDDGTAVFTPVDVVPRQICVGKDVYRQRDQVPYSVPANGFGDNRISR